MILYLQLIDDKNSDRAPFYAPVLKGPPEYLGIGSSFCLFVGNSVLLTNKVQCLNLSGDTVTKLGWLVHLRIVHTSLQHKHMGVGAVSKCRT